MHSLLDLIVLRRPTRDVRTLDGPRTDVLLDLILEAVKEAHSWI